MAVREYLDKHGLGKLIELLRSLFKRTWHGTRSEWDALSEEEKDKWEQAEIEEEDNNNGNGVVFVADKVEKGNYNPVTSNAVAALDEAMTRDTHFGNLADIITINATYNTVYPIAGVYEWFNRSGLCILSIMGLRLSRTDAVGYLAIDKGNLPPIAKVDFGSPSVSNIHRYRTSISRQGNAHFTNPDDMDIAYFGMGQTYPTLHFRPKATNDQDTQFNVVLIYPTQEP